MENYVPLHYIMKDYIWNFVRWLSEGCGKQENMWESDWDWYRGDDGIGLSMMVWASTQNPSPDQDNVISAFWTELNYIIINRTQTGDKH